MVREEETQIISALRGGDEAAFMRLVQSYQGSLVRVAAMIIGDAEVAQEVVQETWIAVLKALPTFEGRSSLKTWIFTILMNRARTAARREGRYIGLALETDESGDDLPTVTPDRFHPAQTGVEARGWITPPRSWEEMPEEVFLSGEVRRLIHRTIDTLPQQQREVITLRDVEGVSAEEACNILSVSESNQRVLLHRARSKVRRALEAYLGE
ncbi:MAG: sigma-70 family RNA polymerase sigma factor [Anaerolineae bacterium]|nr:sigma-70 family RNA polymerase sigma factor [Anaerolineae bacterium]NUQ04310.1 sigma-70 family RNA polymerase sigma factor [Anaerolineae bacterium]